ncbi:MAG: hypothetical protein ACEQR8_08880 [Cypionkella sp.]
MTRRADPRAVRTPVPRDQLPAFEPVPRQRARHDGWTPERQRAFIEALADTGSVEAACRAVDMSSVGAYTLRRQPGAESFRAAWDAALDCGVRMLEDKVMERAIHGTEVPVLSAGQHFGTRRVYNERLAMLILQARLPEKYGLQRARAMNGLDRQTLARKKREWRREWELELAHKARLAGLAAGDGEDDQAVTDSIDEMLDRLRAADDAAMSPRTRALYEAWQASKAEDAARGYQWWLDPRNPHYEGPADGEAPPPPAPGEESAEAYAARALPPPGWGDKAGEDAVEEDPGPRVRSLKDEGW